MYTFTCRAILTRSSVSGLAAAPHLPSLERGWHWLGVTWEHPSWPSCQSVSQSVHTRRVLVRRRDHTEPVASWVQVREGRGCRNTSSYLRTDQNVHRPLNLLCTRHEGLRDDLDLRRMNHLLAREAQLVPFPRLSTKSIEVLVLHADEVAGEEVSCCSPENNASLQSCLHGL